MVIMVEKTTTHFYISPYLKKKGQGAMLGVSCLGQGQRERHVKHKATGSLVAVGSWCFKPGQ